MRSRQQLIWTMISIEFFQLLLAISLGIVKATDESFIYVVNLDKSQAPATKTILRQLEVKGELKIQTEIEFVKDDVINMTESVARKVSNLIGVSSITKDYWNYFQALGWVDEVQPHEEHGAGHRHLEEHIPYGIRMINAAGVHAITPDGIKEPKKICIVDTGYTNGHPDLPVLDASSDGYTVYGSSWGTDMFGHGTHVAGTIGAIGNNDVGVPGVNSDPDKFSFFIGKALGDEGDGELNDSMKTVAKCVEVGADIVSLSIGGFTPSESDANMFQQFYEDNNILFVSASGNDGNGNYSYPASYDHVMSVAAVNQNMDHPWFSQENDQVEISAPGVGVYSTFKDNGYKYMSGTSMAVPHVSGVAALIWGHFPNCTNHQIRHALLKSAHNRASNGNTCDETYGYGIVDAEAAYTLLNEVGCDGVEDSNHVSGGCSFLSNQPTSTSREFLREKDIQTNQVEAQVISILNDSCKLWCNQISIPFKSESTDDLQKCHFINLCNGCEDCA